MTWVLADILGVKGEGQRISIEGLGNRLGELCNVIEVLDAHKTPLLSVMTIPRKEKKDWLLVLRVRSKDAQEAVRAIKEKGFRVTDVS